MVSFAYPIDRLDWALFSVVILFHHFFPLLEKVEIRVFILPCNFPAVLIIFTGRGGAGNPPFPAGRVPRGTGRPSLVGMFGWQSVFDGEEIVREEDVVHNAAQIYNSVERNGLLSALYFRRACTDTASNA